MSVLPKQSGKTRHLFWLGKVKWLNMLSKDFVCWGVYAIVLIGFRIVNGPLVGRFMGSFIVNADWCPYAAYDTDDIERQ